MAKTHDSVFIKEFKDMMDGRRHRSESLNLGSLPIPQLPTMLTDTPKGKIAVVKGVSEPFFERLNKQEVQLVGKTSLKKRQVLSNGDFRKDEKGQYVVTNVAVPHTHIAVLSDLSIGLRRHIQEGGRQVEYTPKEGFKYVDYVTTPKGRKYIYIIPKEYVYRLNMSSLILTPNKRRVYYKGCKLALQDGNYVYLYVVPYKYRESLDARVIGLKSTPNFNKEVVHIIKSWMAKGVTFDLSKTGLEMPTKGVSNIAIQDFEGTIMVDDFKAHGVSLKDEKESEAVLQ